MEAIVPSQVAGIRGSGIREIREAVWRDSASVIGLHVGEPNFPTPANVITAMSEALARGETHYAPNAGIPQLREAVADKVRSLNGLHASDRQVVVTAGGMQAIFLSLAITVRSGDEVLIPDPGWPNYEMAVRLLGAVPVRYPVHADGPDQIDLGALESLTTARTRVIIVNSPSNPLGIVFSDTTTRQLMGFVDAHALVAVSDECYESITFGQKHHSPATLDGQGRVLSCFSLSKTYAMTGVRVGYLVAAADVASVAARMQEGLLSCVNTVAQYGALAAITGPQDVVTMMVEQYRQRRDRAVALLQSAGVRFIQPQGAFYLWLSIGEGAESSLDWALRLLQERHVAVAPGTAFGSLGRRWIRISLATSMPDLVEGVERIISSITA